MFFRVFFSKISAISTPRTMKFGHKDYFYTKTWHQKKSEKFQFLGHFSGVFFIHKLKNDVFVHNFLSHQTSELPEIWNLSKHWTNLKNNEDRFSKFAFLHFLRQPLSVITVSGHGSTRPGSVSRNSPVIISSSLGETAGEAQ